jgi:signal peptidase II
MKTKHRPRIRLILAILILSSCIGCDQVTKTIATQSFKDLPPKSYLADTVRLSYALNPGGFLSLGSKLPVEYRKWIFIGFNSCVMLALCLFLTLKRELPLSLFLSVAFILAGGIGNLMDRLWNDGRVTDFINLGIGPIRTGVFNIADIAVTFGAIAIGWFSIKASAREDGFKKSTHQGGGYHGNGKNSYR